jgi:hypothetical protein
MDARGYLFRNGAALTSRTIVTNGITRLNEYAGLSRVLTPYTEYIRPGMSGFAMGLSNYQVECGDGTRLEGSTEYPYVFQDGQTLDGPIVLEVVEADFVPVSSSDQQSSADIHATVRGREA